MWHTNPNTNQTQKLPSVLKNFNAFDLLEPEKVNLESTDVSTAVLIDVTDSMNREEKSESDLSLDLHGSFLEKVKKTEFDLLDLYQNIYVTPQEIKKETREDCCDKSKNLDPEFEAFKVDFTELYERAEQGKKLSNWTKDTENVNNATKNIPQLNLTNENLRSFDEILDNAISSRCSQLKLEPPPKLELDIPEQDLICEDEIDEFLQPKLVIHPSIFKETAQNISSYRPMWHFNNDTPPATSLNLNDRRQNLLKTLSKLIKDSDKPSNNTKASPEQQGTRRSVYNHDVRTQILTNNLTDLNSHHSACPETILHKKAQKSDATTKNTINLMHKGGKEERPAKLGAYQKSEGFLKPEMPLKPPSYYFGSGTSVAHKPEVLMEDCSLKRAKALQTRIAFEKFVNKGVLPP